MFGKVRGAKDALKQRRQEGLVRPKMVKPKTAPVPAGFRAHKEYADNGLIVCISCGQSGGDRKSVRHRKNCRNPAARGGRTETASPPSSKREAKKAEKYKNSKAIGRRGF
jgi:hypothetical protein